MDETLVHTPITGDLVKVLGVEPKTRYKAETFTQAFLKNNTPTHDTKSVLSHKAVILEYSKGKKKKLTRTKPKGINAHQKKELKIFHVKSEHQRYELFSPLHELWKQYIFDLCNGLNSKSSPDSVQKKLLKADFHGAIIIVIQSKCPSYVGASGIIIQEFKHVFKIITKQDRIKGHFNGKCLHKLRKARLTITVPERIKIVYRVIPKRNSIFKVEINGFISCIYGNKFEHRASERSAKKFKISGTIDL
ncbi:ribonuclease P protein subunit p29 isoform X1 [Stigmatopora nigra]